MESGLIKHSRDQQEKATASDASRAQQGQTASDPSEGIKLEPRSVGCHLPKHSDRRNNCALTR